MHFFLASQSPRRRELLRLLNIPFEATAVNADEDTIQTTNLLENVKERALLKAHTLFNKGGVGDAFIIAADTTVVLDGQMLNKPVDAEHAKEMLTGLRSRAHQVYSGVVVMDGLGQQRLMFSNTAVVTMRAFNDSEIQNYIESGDPFDKAGAYAIQNQQFNPVAALEGCFLNVMGLPICELAYHLLKANFPVQPAVESILAEHGRFPNCPDFQKLLTIL